MKRSRNQHCKVPNNPPKKYKINFSSRNNILLGIRKPYCGALPTKLREAFT